MFLCILTHSQLCFQRKKFPCNNAAHLLLCNDVMDIVKCNPLHRIRFTRLKDNVLQRHLRLHAVVVKKQMRIIGCIQIFEVFFRLADARLLPQFPHNCLKAGLPCLGCAAGIFPRAAEALFRCAAGYNEKKRF